MYYNARYYDPSIGQFISPDTIVPDPGNVLDYNRYMYVRGNPVKFNDPSGHQSCELCNSTILSQIVRQVIVNVLGPKIYKAMGEPKPTAVSVYAGGNLSGGAGLHGEAAHEYGVTFNWYSGDFMFSQANSAGLKGGWMLDNSVGVQAGGALHFNAANTDAIQNASVYASALVKQTLG